MTVPRLVLDTNVLVSGLVFGGPPAEIIQLGLNRDVTFVTSPILLEELERILHLKFPQVYPVIRDAFEAISSITHLVTPSEIVDIITQDPSDNRVLECAAESRAEAIISGDKHLLRLKTFRSIPILKPAEFLKNRI